MYFVGLNHFQEALSGYIFNGLFLAWSALEFGILVSTGRFFPKLG